MKFVDEATIASLKSPAITGLFVFTSRISS